MRYLSCLNALLIASLATEASAQAVAYRHRSTAYGDYLSGSADLVLAYGRAAEHHAEAFAITVRAANDLEDLRQKRLRAYYYEREYRDQLIREKAEERKVEQHATEAERDSDALALVRQYELGVFVWPNALQRPEYSSSTRLIESILGNWTPENGSDFRPYRTALLTEAAVLRTRVSTAADLRFEDKATAVRTLASLQRLAGLEDASTRDAAPKLAVR